MTEGHEDLNREFDKVFKAEISGWVAKNREYRSANSEDGVKYKNLQDVDHPDPSNELVGLAMSGGGTRSAVFNLGVVQALAQYGLMNQVDYMSTISGGGYTGSSLTSLCAEDLLYDMQDPEKNPSRLDMTTGRFPYAFPGPFAQPPDGNRTSPEVHGLESPATRHVREYARLLIPGAGFFHMETWTTISRYLVSTFALWLLFLLPMATAILLPTILIPEGVWNRGDPFAVTSGGIALAKHPWIVLAPLAAIGLVGLLALFQEKDRRRSDQSANSIMRWLQRIIIVFSMVTAAAVLFVLGVWGISVLLIELKIATWQFGLIVSADGAAAFVALRYGPLRVDIRGLLNRSDRIKRALWNAAFAISGYLVLVIGLLGWHHILWNGWDLWLGWQGFKASREGYLTAWVAVAVMMGLTWLFAPWLLNRLSLNRLYQQRLQRTWLIAATSGNPDKQKEIDDVSPELGWERIWIRPDLKVGNIIGGPNWLPSSPYPLICTTLNLPGSTSPKLLNRKSDPFIIGPVYTGSALTGWQATKDLKVFKDMPLARAAAISAAAFSPNMGRVTNTTLSVITTLFNARLGWWVRNPHKLSRLNRLGWPPYFLLYWKEMLGMASHTEPMIYLSDGGHFENLGLYELLRRRCKYIIAIDATGEPSKDQPLTFEGLGLALRRARIDFGVLVDIDLRPMMRDEDSGQVGSYFAVGQIRYPKTGGHGSGEQADPDSGTLVFIKGGVMEGSMPPDLISYHRSGNPSFPHDPTTDQQFDEAQFESYRELGFLAGRSVCQKADQYPDPPTRFAFLDDSYKKLLKKMNFTEA